jgi:hypothetical protein
MLLLYYLPNAIKVLLLRKSDRNELNAMLYATVTLNDDGEGSSDDDGNVNLEQDSPTWVTGEMNVRSMFLG